VDVRDIDGRDTAVARRFWEIGRDSEAAYRVHDFFVPWASAEVTLSKGRADTDLLLLGAFDGEQMTGAASVAMPLLDNLHLAYVSIHVHPDHQRRGVGRALASACEAAVQQRGRRVVVGEAYGQPDAPGVGQAFAESLGYTVAIEDGIKVVDLDATEPTWAAMEQEVAPRSSGYTLVSWYDAVPDEHLGGYCLISEAFNDEAPSGDLELEAEVWDEDRVRKREADNLPAGRHDVSTAALAPDGTMVGLTEIGVNENASHRGFQSGTLVAPAHRGRALGLSMKVANQRQLRARFPGCKVLMTGNAGVNVAMNAVNDRLGYRLVETCVELQKAL